MNNLLVAIVSTVFRGIVQVLINETVRAEQAEAQVQALQQQLAERTREAEALQQVAAAASPAEEGGER